MAEQENACQCKYCQHLRGDPERTRDRLIREAEFRERAGKCSHMWVRRRVRDPRYHFPQIVKRGRFSFIWETDAMLWLSSPHVSMRTEPNFPVKAA